jgi:hypothetical protein
MFITAVLTVIGFSVHDTIVVFDRVRENIVRHAGEPFEDVMNHSLTQTLGRSVNTSITVLLTLVALRLFGGTTIHSFVLALLIGITSGTYSSIFNASLLLYSWNAGELGRWFGFGRRAEPARARSRRPAPDARSELAGDTPPRYESGRSCASQRSRQRRSHSSGPRSSIRSLASPNESAFPRIGVV